MSLVGRCVTLVMLGVLGMAGAQGQAGHGAGKDKELAELQHYTLTMDKVTRFMQTMYGFQTYAKEHPEAANVMKSDSEEPKDIAAMEKQNAAHPEVVGILTAHGFTAHEFVVLTLTVFQAAFAAYAQEQGADAGKLASDAQVNPANITFMQQHKAEFDELQKKYPVRSGD